MRKRISLHLSNWIDSITIFVPTRVRGNEWKRESEGRVGTGYYLSCPCYCVGTGEGVGTSYYLSCLCSCVGTWGRVGTSCYLTCPCSCVGTGVGAWERVKTRISNPYSLLIERLCALCDLGVVKRGKIGFMSVRPERSRSGQQAVLQVCFLD